MLRLTHNSGCSVTSMCHIIYWFISTGQQLLSFPSLTYLSGQKDSKNTEKPEIFRGEMQMPTPRRLEVVQK